MVYLSPHQFEPLLPQGALDTLVAESRRVFAASGALRSALHPSTLETVRELVRSMNSYYSNRIEGQSTHPANIERALRADFSGRPEVAQRQRLALAHIAAERELEGHTAGSGWHDADALSSEFIVAAHRALYGRLSEADRRSPDGVLTEPGALRSSDVIVGRHHAPAHATLPAFLRRLDEVYPRLRGVDALLYGIAAAHHRYAWVHPFIDGNGRACRLQTHAALFPISGGLWSVNRGLARDRDGYYAQLARADQPRQGDLDGRGNLSERALREWCEYFVAVCKDQVDFMGRVLHLDALRERLAALVAVRQQAARYTRYKNYRPEMVEPLFRVLALGPLSRGDFVRMTGTAERTGQRMLAQLVGDGLLVSDGPRSPVRMGLPLDALGVLFPNLYPEAGTTNLEQ
jgi:Fic family protein